MSWVTTGCATTSQYLIMHILIFVFCKRVVKDFTKNSGGRPNIALGDLSESTAWAGASWRIPFYRTQSTTFRYTNHSQNWQLLYFTERVKIEYNSRRARENNVSGTWVQRILFYSEHNAEVCQFWLVRAMYNIPYRKYVLLVHLDSTHYCASI